MEHDQPDRAIAVNGGDNCLVGQFSAMASPCEILVESADQDEAKSLTAAIAAEAWRIEDKFSRYLAGNIIDRINNADGKTVEVDDETAELIDFAVTLHELSEGAFDVTAGVLRRVWNFDGSNRLPSRRAVKDVIRQVGWHQVNWQRPLLTMKRGMEIDLGGIGKEYAVDRCADIAKQQSAAACLVNFGGDLVSTAAPCNRSGWTVGIESAVQQESAGGRVLKLKVGALATSGDARRYLLCDGVRYSHILDPKTGWPVPDAPRSVTVAADTCTQAGMLSTIAMLQGAQAEIFLDAQGIRYWCDRDVSV